METYDNDTGQERDPAQEYVDIKAELRHQTHSAFLLFDGRKDPAGREIKEWVPKSLAVQNEDGTFTMPEWIAKEKGFI